MEEELKLREVREDEIPPLAEQARKYLPHTLSVHGLLSIGFPYGTCHLLGTKIYVPKKKDFPFFIVFTNVVDKVNRQTATVFWDPNEVEIEKAKLLLASLPDWDWNVLMYFNACSLPALRELEQIIPGEHGLCAGNLEHAVVCEGHGYILSPADSQHDFKSEGKFILSELTETLAPTIHYFWKKNNFDSIEGIKKIIRTLPTMGVFEEESHSGSMGVFEEESHPGDKADDRKTSKFLGQSGLKSNLMAEDIKSNMKAVAWVVCKPIGEMGLTYTMPSYRRRGLASIATTKLSETLLKKNITPYVFITDGDIPSIAFHEKIGFRKTAPVGWHLYKQREMPITDF